MGPSQDEPRPLPLDVLRELRTDHAGETGAVMIYRGVLAVARDPAVRDFAAHHLETELRHLKLVEQVVPPRWRSRLLPLWRVAGWLTGALPALCGPRAVYATIQSVETFVDRHYAEQVERIDDLLRREATGADQDGPPGGQPALEGLRRLLEECRRDEVTHRDDAASRWDETPGPLLSAWRRMVSGGSQAAVGVCRHF